LIGTVFALIQGALVDDTPELKIGKDGKTIFYHRHDRLFTAHTNHLEETDLERLQTMMRITKYWDDTGDTRVDRVRVMMMQLTESLNILRMIEVESLYKSIFTGPRDALIVMGHCQPIFKALSVLIDGDWIDMEEFMEPLADMEVEVENAAANVRVSITRRYI
jgi:hypothetical protein